MAKERISLSIESDKLSVKVYELDGQSPDVKLSALTNLIVALDNSKITTRIIVMTAVVVTALVLAFLLIMYF